MAGNKMSIGDAAVAQIALTKVIQAADAHADVLASDTAGELAAAILALAADVQYKPVSARLTVTFDLSVSSLTPRGGGGDADGD